MKFDNATRQTISEALNALIANTVPFPEDLDKAIELLNRALENHEPVGGAS